MKKPDLGGRPKVIIDRVTILGCVSKVYYKHLKAVKKKMTEETGRHISMSQIIRIALEEVFPAKNVGKTEFGEDENQLDMFAELKKK